MTSPTPAVPPTPVPRPADPRVSRPDPGETITRAMAGLDGLDGRPPAEHVDAFERVHAALGEALAAGSA